MLQKVIPYLPLSHRRLHARCSAASINRQRPLRILRAPGVKTKEWKGGRCGRRRHEGKIWCGSGDGASSEEEAGSAVKSHARSPKGGLENGEVGVSKLVRLVACHCFALADLFARLRASTRAFRFARDGRAGPPHRRNLHTYKYFAGRGH